jgi:hypothetical protein
VSARAWSRVCVGSSARVRCSCLLRGWMIRLRTSACVSLDGRDPTAMPGLRFCSVTDLRVRLAGPWPPHWLADGAPKAFAFRKARKLLESLAPSGFAFRGQRKTLVRGRAPARRASAIQVMRVVPELGRCVPADCFERFPTTGDRRRLGVMSALMSQWLRGVPLSFGTLRQRRSS